MSESAGSKRSHHQGDGKFERPKWADYPLDPANDPFSNDFDEPIAFRATEREMELIRK